MRVLPGRIRQVLVAQRARLCRMGLIANTVFSCMMFTSRVNSTRTRHEDLRQHTYGWITAINQFHVETIGMPRKQAAVKR